MIKLRITRPDLPRPYRAWGYPVTPAIFLLVTLFMMYYLVVERPLQSFFGALIMVSGLLIYVVFRKEDDSGTGDLVARNHPHEARHIDNVSHFQNSGCRCGHIARERTWRC